jgi:hypothetical protein
MKMAFSWKGRYYEPLLNLVARLTQHRSVFGISPETILGVNFGSPQLLFIPTGYQYA